jgi:large subunit ribosomal protein L30
MKAVIRIRGDVNLKRQIRETLERLRLKRKYSCIVGNFSKEQLWMIKKVKDFIAFGDISNETLEKLIENRAQLIDKTKKINAKKMAEELRENKGYEKIGIICN